MYNYKNILYLVSALSAAEKAMHYAKKFNTPVQFFEAEEQLYFNATITLLIAIGEEVKKTDPQLLLTQPALQWQNITDMRNVLAHDYRGVDPEIVFSVVKVELPKIKIVLIQFIKLFPEKEVGVVLETKHYQHLKNIILIPG